MKTKTDYCMNSTDNDDVIKFKYKEIVHYIYC